MLSGLSKIENLIIFFHVFYVILRPSSLEMVITSDWKLKLTKDVLLYTKKYEGKKYFYKKVQLIIELH